MLAGMDAGISSAYKKLKIISQDDSKRQKYETRMKAIRDYNQGMIEAREKGMEEGIERGMKKGMEKGRTEGAFDIAKNMLTAGFDIGTIAKMTNLREDQIKTLRN